MYVIEYPELGTKLSGLSAEDVEFYAVVAEACRPSLPYVVREMTLQEKEAAGMVKKNSFPWDLILLVIVTIALFLGAHGLALVKKAHGAPLVVHAQKHETARQDAERRDDGGLMCSPCRGPHIDLRTGKYRAFPGPGPGLKLYKPKELQN